MKEIFNQWGFKNGADYFATILGFKFGPFLSAQVLGSFAAASIAFCADWIWNPPYAIGFVVALTFLNAWYGIRVSKLIHKEPFNPKKFKKTLSIAVSDMLLMSCVHITIKLIPNLEFAGDFFLGWIICQRASSVYNHMEQLQLQKGGLLKYLKIHVFKVLEAKVGAEIVDNIQNPPEPNPENNGPQ